MPTLRKACTNCTTSKRKCVVRNPKCVRCSEKNLECVYDLDPLLTPPTKNERLLAFGFHPSSHKTLGRCILRNIQLRAPGCDPTISVPGGKHILDMVRLGFGTVPELLKRVKPASFVHPKLQISNKINPIATLVEQGAWGVCSQSFMRLKQTDIKMVSATEALTALQALLVHLAESLFSTCPGEQEQADQSLTLLSDWTQNLLALVDIGMPQCQSSWQNWLLAESIRRTIFMAYVLNLSVIGYKHGYCPYWLFTESLPFDARPGLWMAESPQAWIGAANVTNGDEVGEQLSSYHEFAESFRGQTIPDFGGDAFLTLVTYAHNGPGGN
ncbi:hypothetical protein BT63DRAFT_167793 [Microthyrium microscopicum]|uniref:Zn(2)-C6 fungal-type domain-containing protein n=1 Tax=Microthyrium microscopicum TaxID=703497 RepID=A0A6A6UNI6_9PEZI|nr:hypothetical protein BT63DRAFT_167793 [Microthyrium microscopicum]